MKSVMWFKCVIGLILLLQIGCSSHSNSPDNTTASSGSSSGQKPNNPFDQAYALGGIVSGLKGQLVLSNGIDQQAVIIKNNGPFILTKQLASGELFNIRVESRPQDQVCEVVNGKGFLIEDDYSVRVFCVSAVEREVEFVRPFSMGLNKLTLSSNLQQLDSLNAPVVQEKNNRLLVFNHSFVTLNYARLSNRSPEPVLLAHVNDLEEYQAAAPNERMPVKITVDSTIEALLLLEPAIATALLERSEEGAKPAKFYQVLRLLMGRLKSTPDYKRLSDQLYSLLATQQTLISQQGELNAPVQTLVKKAAAELLQLSFINVHVDQESILASGVALKIRPTAEHIWLDMANLGARNLVAISSQFNTLSLDGSANTPSNGVDNTVSLNGSDNGMAAVTTTRISDKPNLTAPVMVTFVGPGYSGQYTIQHKSLYRNAVVRSGLQQHFFKSLNLSLGLIDPKRFKLEDCVAAQYHAVVTELSNQLDDTQNYSQVYQTIFDQLRNRLIMLESPILNEISACEKFGLGNFIQTQTKLAMFKQNVTSVLKVAQSVYTLKDYSAALYEQEGLTRFTTTLAHAAIESTWNYSESLQLQLKANRLTAYIDDVIQLSANCIDPSAQNAPVACDITWTLSDGTSVLNPNLASGSSQIQHAFTAPGIYDVTVTAKSIKGFSVQQILKITIQPKIPKLRISTLDGKDIDISNSELNFGTVLLGEVGEMAFRLRNVGQAPLEITDIRLADSAFFVTEKSFRLAPNQDAQMHLNFRPSEEKAYTTSLFILSNDPIFTLGIQNIQLTGKGSMLGDVAAGQWSMTGATGVRDFKVQRAKVDYGQEGLLSVRVFSELTKEFPQMVFNLQNYKPSTSAKIYTLDDRDGQGCFGSMVVDTPQNTYCTSTLPIQSRPITGQVTVEPVNNGQLKLSFQYEAALNALACGDIDISQCDTTRIQGQIFINAPF